MIYQYMTNRIIEFFLKLEMNTAEKYYISFDNQENVNELYEKLKSNAFCEPFIYSNKIVKEEYNTIVLNTNKTKVIIAAAIENKISKDFLVTLRNTIGYGDYIDYSILFIFSGELDSLSRGAISMMDQNMPLNITNVKNHLSVDIEEKIVSRLDREIIKIMLDRTVDDYSTANSSIFDISPYLDIIERTKISETDYRNFNLFPYENNDNSFNISGLKNDLKENEKHFTKVMQCHNFGNFKEIDANYVGSVKQSLKDATTWENITFSKVIDSYNTAMEKAKISYLDPTNGTGMTKSKEGFPIFNIPEKDTSLGNRIRNIIIFDSIDSESISFDLKFNKTLKSEYLKKGEKISKIIGQRIEVNIERQFKNQYSYIEYCHEGKNSSKYEFKIIVLPININDINNIKSPLKVLKSKKTESSIPTIIVDVDDVLIIGGKKEREQVLISEENSISYNLTDSAYEFIFSKDFNDEFTTIEFISNGVNFNVRANLFGKNEKVTLNASDIFTKKLEHCASFTKKTDTQIEMGLNQFKVNSKELTNMLKSEAYIINNHSHQIEVHDSEFNSIELRIPKQLSTSYSKICNYFVENNTLPLLTFWNEEIKTLIENHITLFFEIISELAEGSSVREDYKDLLYLGSVKYKNRLYLSSINIVNLLYMNHLTENYSNMEFPTRFADFVNPNGLLPYIYFEEKLYKIVNDNKIVGWTEYRLDSSKIKDTQYTNKIIKEKISQYLSHFKHIFVAKENPTLIINLVKVSDINSFAVGIFDFFLSKIKDDEYEKESRIPTIEINIYSNNLQFNNKFDLLNTIYDIDVLEERLEYSFEIEEYDKRDVVKIIREKLKIFSHYNHHNTEYKMSHLCFSEMESKVSVIEAQTNKLDTGVFEYGLISNISLTKDNDHFKMGFGSNVIRIKSDLIEKCMVVNEFALNGKSDYKSDYRKESSIALDISDFKNYESLFSTSDWVVFIAPDVDLSFFSDTFKDAFVLHYNDQYTNNSSYDAITLTKNIDKYSYVLKNYLSSKKFTNIDKTIHNIINSFNAINGEWLLKMVGNRGNFGYEKISIISAVKQLIVSFSHPNMIWIPISLEEILRISGAVGLSGVNGIFSVKELDKHGCKSDDLLLIGFEKTDSITNVMFIPVEVKIGNNNSGVIAKAKEQVIQTFDTLYEYLYPSDKSKILQNKVLTHFFIQLALTTLHKLKNFNVTDFNQDLYNSIFNDVISSNYKLALLEEIGKGIIFSFKKETGAPKFVKNDDIFLIEMYEEIAYELLEKTIDQIKQSHNGNDSYNIINLLKYNEVLSETPTNVYLFDSAADEHIIDDYKVSTNDKIVTPKEIKDIVDFNDNDDVTLKLSNGNLDNNASFNPNNLENIYAAKTNSDYGRLLLGSTTNIKEKVYWEFQHKGLQNRHLLITGSSGSGKTYALQTLLYETSKSKIPVVIFDYTDGFTKEQLSPEFVNEMDKNIEYYIVLFDKIGINPFEKFSMKIGNREIKEESYQVAQRIASTFRNVYSFGDQQYSAIYEATKNALDSGSQNLNFNKLIDWLKESENKSAQTVVSKIQPFVDSKVFNFESNLNWNSIRESGKIHIFQLTGYNREIQTLITELVLWDMWNYFVLNGSESKPFIVVLDEAQNLSHDENSPSGKILTEGRKFGISGWYATQFLKNAVSNDEIQRLQQSAQKLYFRPTDSGVDEVANYLSADKNEINEWKKRLLNLKKGQCVTVGYSLALMNLNRYEPKIIDIIGFSDRIDI